MALALMALLVSLALLALALERHASFGKGQTLAAIDATTALAFQLEREGMRLASELGRQPKDADSPEDEDSLRLRFDIFLSRIDLMQSNPSTALIEHRREYTLIRQLLDEFQTMAEPVFAQPTLAPRALRPLHDLLVKHGPDFQALSLATSSEFKLKLEEQEQDLRQQNHWIIGLLGGQLLLLLLCLMALLRRQKLQHIEQQTLRAAKTTAESLSRTKSEFLANMSHEIRTPLNALIGLSHLLLDGSLNARQQDFISRIHVTSRSLLTLLNDILDQARIESGHLQLEIVPLSPADVLDNTRALFEIQALEKGLALEFEPAPDLPGPLLGDPLRLQQVMNNLVGNAIKFTSRGSVVVSASCLQADAGSVYLRFSVRDSGIGMDAVQAHRIFLPFEQADASTTRRFGGSGLGLAIARQLVEMMGGEIGVESESGCGSCFWFTLRLQLARQADQVPLQGQEPQRAWSATMPVRLGGARVLVVDDNATNLLVAQSYLQRMGLEVETADNGLAAVEMAGCRHYDIILMDLQMPELDGCEATQAIRQREQAALAATGGPTSRVPIIALSAASMPEDIERALSSGMNDYLAKPLDMQRLAGMLRQWIPALAA